VEIEAIVRSFVEQVAAAIEAAATERVQAAVSAALSGAGTAAGRAHAEPRQPAAGRTAPKVRRLNLSPEALAKRRLQGKYLGALRALPKPARERVSAVAHEQGVAAALKFAATLR
jgi:hypothetical protein